ncbi:hypothetical protein A3G48_04045 [Candidatus Nomurabacteria bacterium RIFCSPLOWO2_12_FULL_40_42]|nr:MAG: hypothetical protein A2W56_04310 [Candidatus Nomurabacteria bacterium RIFCSPHIGHO2_02_41_18]OGI78207.1 MAG: hypothetical protein A3C65_00390 [Candidatus Nomurabacteria bacterium RIFCSPHIGHO2_02_FULL_41_150]OGI91500.1 MAG: hypothetical protein A3A06_03845 [Candidatus Nomurabacteria bacterium RIFCSPLOWO2_01_FULL_41_220]OGJ03496.1 MAG: hypothetical protein A3G48_04045 [Candidatus Nomurabacteria bacterium RIFCSPLOWO2_12_FULL_40_42]
MLIIIGFNIPSIAKIFLQQKFFLYFRAKHFEFVLHGISNLLLQNKTVCPAEGGAGFRTQNPLPKTGGNQRDALRASRISASQKPPSSILVCLLYQVRTYFQNKVR